MKAFSSILAVIAAALVLVAPASAASTKDRVRTLEAQVADLQARLSGESPSVRVGQLERQVQELTGKVEQLSFQLTQANQRLTAISGVLANDPAAAAALQAIGSSAVSGPVSLTPGAGPTDLGATTPGAATQPSAIGDPIADQIAATAGEPATGQAPAAGGAVLPTDVTLPSDPNAAFDHASRYLLQGDYPRAQVAFENYVAAFPNSQRAADAQFRLGEIYLATGANSKAASAFITHIRQYPNDPRSAEAYLKLGSAFARLKKNTEACKIFRALKTKFPTASPAILQRADIEMARIPC